MKKKTNDEKPIIDIVREETQKVFSERFSKEVKKLLKKGYTQAKIAKELGISPSSVSKYMNGKRNT